MHSESDKCHGGKLKECRALDLELTQQHEHETELDGDNREVEKAYSRTRFRCVISRSADAVRSYCAIHSY